MHLRIGIKKSERKLAQVINHSFLNFRSKKKKNIGVIDKK